jgi:3-oxoacyl-[acyl-carrier-protein] synthase-3
MKFNTVYLDSMGYELAPNVLSSDDIEKRLEPLYQALHFQKGQLEMITGIRERRYWDPGFPMYEGAALAGKKALQSSNLSPDQIGMLVYGGVCRDQLEPATACAVCHALGLGPETLIHDVSNACLGVLNGIILIASAIELGQIQAGMVVSCESSRQIMDLSIQRMLETRDMDIFRKTVATLTGGSGAIAVILSHESLSSQGHRLLGGTIRNAAQHHDLCRWGPDTGIPATMPQIMETDSIGVLQHGVTLGVETYRMFREEMQWTTDKPDKIICHQVGATHQKTILDALRISKDKDFVTYPFLGNIGTASLPITAAIASERGFLEKADLVGFFGIGSGLNCMMLGLEW